MIDIKQLRENPQQFKDTLKKKFQDPELIDHILVLDKKFRESKKKRDDMRAMRNTLSQQINQAKKKKEDASKFIEEAKKLPSQVKQVEEEMKQSQEELHKALQKVPNLIHASVPIGKDDTENVELAVYGTEKQVKEVKPHQQVAEELGGVDFESAAKTSGNGFYYLEKDIALLNQALIRLGVDTMHRHGFDYIETPLMLRGDIIERVVDLHDQENQIYKIENEDLYLIGTSEHALIGRFYEKTLREDQLPIKHSSYSMCFRKEKGSHGLDERGLFRTHQFNKIEMIVICKPEESMEYYKKMQEITVELFVALGLPVRVLQICSGDLGNLKHTQVDVEVWSPRRDEWIEVGSCSNLTDAQARALSIRVQGKELYTPHTLNNTCIATSRALVALLENCQDENGHLVLPEVLWSYMYGKKELIPSKS